MEVGLINIKTVVMKISVKHYDEEITISKERDDLTFVEYMDMVQKISVAIFGEHLVNDYWEN